MKTQTNESQKLELQKVTDYSNVNSEFFDKLESIQEEEMTATDAEYLEFQEGEVMNLIFTGFVAGKFDNTEKEMACFTGRNGWQYVNANAVIVNAMKKLVEPCPVRITCTGETKNSNGNKYKTFKIFTL